jgi:hypothetical protein
MFFRQLQGEILCLSFPQFEELGYVEPIDLTASNPKLATLIFGVQDD